MPLELRLRLHLVLHVHLVRARGTAAGPPDRRGLVSASCDIRGDSAMPIVVASSDVACVGYRQNLRRQDRDRFRHERREAQDVAPHQHQRE